MSKRQATKSSPALGGIYDRKKAKMAFYTIYAKSDLLRAKFLGESSLLRSFFIGWPVGLLLHGLLVNAQFSFLRDHFTADGHALLFYICILGGIVFWMWLPQIRHLWFRLRGFRIIDGIYAPNAARAEYLFYTRHFTKVGGLAQEPQASLRKNEPSRGLSPEILTQPRISRLLCSFL